jgi:hypothetical protein
MDARECFLLRCVVMCGNYTEPVTVAAQTPESLDRTPLRAYMFLRIFTRCVALCR